MISEYDKQVLLDELNQRGWTSLNKFAKIVDLSYPTALRMKNSGQVNIIPVGGVNRVYKAEVMRFLEHGNATPNAPEDSGKNLPKPYR